MHSEREEMYMENERDKRKKNIKLNRIKKGRGENPNYSYIFESRITKKKLKKNIYAFGKENMK